MTGAMKWYYLVQFAFWIQQVIVVNLERHRKDYSQMLFHHVLTCTLLFTSYSFYMTRVGNVILCLMDVADIVLSVRTFRHFPSSESTEYALTPQQVCQSPQISSLPDRVRHCFRHFYCYMGYYAPRTLPDRFVVCLEGTSCGHATWLLFNHHKREAVAT